LLAFGAAIAASRLKVVQRIGRAAGRFAGNVAGRTSTLVQKAVNSIKDHMNKMDLIGAKRELNGEVVKLRPDGKPYDHVGEVKAGLDSVRNAIKALQSELKNNNSLSDSARAAAENALSKLSKFKEEVEDFLKK
jgi:hypothetical protein